MGSVGCGPCLPATVSAVGYPWEVVLCYTEMQCFRASKCSFCQYICLLLRSCSQHGRIICYRQPAVW